MLERSNCGMESEPMLMFIFPDRSLAQAVDLVSLPFSLQQFTRVCLQSSTTHRSKPMELARFSYEAVA